MLGFTASGGGLVGAQADVDEVDARLKSASIDTETRKAVQEAVARGVEFLLTHQEDDGSFEEHWAFRNRTVTINSIQTTLLCALALRNVGTERANESAHRAATWAVDQESSAWGAVAHHVQSAGLALMVRHAMPDLALSIDETAQAMTRALNREAGYWGYSLRRGTRGHTPSLKDSHFAVLGLWCAHRLGIDVSNDVWTRHARALAREQTESGSWRWHPSKTLEAMGNPVDPQVDQGVAVGKFMGVATLQLTLAALEDEPGSSAYIRRALRRAMRRIGDDAAKVLADPPEARPQGSPGRPGVGAYSRLWALSHAFILSDLPEYAGPRKAGSKRERRSWFLDAVKWLLRVQDESGGWSPTAGTPVSPPSETDTAYALLFLVRAVETLHPDAPLPSEAVEADDD